MNRAELQQLTRERLRDAKALLAARRWSGAYYLAGYAVECALKSCVIAHLMRTDQFPERRLSEQCWTHNLGQILGLAGLQAEFDAAMATDPELKARWDTVRNWTESSRYTRTSRAEATDLYAAITNIKHGVLSWIQARW
jgi:HEPN domain-containing protein